jgi:glycosyltransferase involved in cell wall biosynthesis
MMDMAAPISEVDRQLPAEMDVSAVMPCLNEEKTLGLCIEKAQACFRRLGINGEVVVADNGSTDRSVEVARSLGARVVTERRKGYGAALIAGFGAARGRVIVMADADDSYDWASLGEFVAKIDEGYDLVMGNRFQGGIAPNAMPMLHRYLGNPVLSGLARVMYQIPIGDFHCGMRAVSRAAWTQMQARTSGMEFATEMVVNAANAGLRIAEIPTRLYPDRRDRPPHLRSFRDGWRHLRFMMTYAPDYLYLAPGSLLAIAGFLGMALLATGPAVLGGFRFGIHFLALASLLALLGVNVLGFGILAKILNAHRHAVREGSFTAWLLEHYTLEYGLLLGLTLLIAGLGADALIFLEWLSRGRGAMEDTVHLAFVASTACVLGVNVIFGAFLLRMIQEDVRG